MANPDAIREHHYDRDAAARASVADGSPWLDDPTAEHPVLDIRTGSPEKPDRRLASALVLGGLYAGFIGWTYFAWYRVPTREFRWGGDGSPWIWRDDSWFGTQQYSAGADKMGHAWATAALARAGTELLDQWGGFPRLHAAIIGTVASELLFLGVEIKDGFAYRFSYGDFVFNTLGAALAFAQSMWPSFDALVDFKVEYVPSAAFRERFKDGDVDVAEDYSGQTYQLNFHLGAIPPLRRSPAGKYLQFVDVTLGFETRGYKPDPTYTITPEMPDFDKSQTVFAGLSLNMQGLADYFLRGRSKPAQKILHGTFEMFAVPYTTLRGLEHSRFPTGQVPDEQ